MIVVVIIVVRSVFGQFFSVKNLSFNFLISADKAYECTWMGNGASCHSITLLVITYVLPFLLVLVLYFFIVKILCQMGRIDVLKRKSSVKRHSSNSLR